MLANHFGAEWLPVAQGEVNDLHETFLVFRRCAKEDHDPGSPLSSV